MPGLPNPQQSYWPIIERNQLSDEISHLTQPHHSSYCHSNSNEIRISLIIASPFLQWQSALVGIPISLHIQKPGAHVDVKDAAVSCQ